MRMPICPRLKTSGKKTFENIGPWLGRSCMGIVCKAVDGPGIALCLRNQCTM